MFAVDTLALSQLAILLASCLMTLASVWTAGRLAPIVLGKEFKPESFREYFFKDDGDMSQSGYVMIMLSASVLLTMLIALTLVAKTFGWHFAA
jgi:hypothetical protein